MAAAIFANMNNKSAPRGFTWIWFIRFAQLALTLIVLGLAAWHSSVFKKYHCDTPSTISYNIACAVLSLIVLAYLILSTGPSNVFKVLPWLVWGQLALDGIMFIFWIAATGTSPLSDEDIFEACYAGYSYNPYTYNYGYDYSKRGLAGSLEPRRSRKSSSSSSNNGNTFTIGSVHARTAMDALLVVLFAITIAATVWWVYQEHRPSGSAAPTTQPHTHDDFQGGAGVSKVPLQEPTATYSHPQMQQSQYYQEQQPQPAPPVYNQSVPHAPYSQPQSGYPSPQMQPVNPNYSAGVH